MDLSMKHLIVDSCRRMKSYTTVSLNNRSRQAFGGDACSASLGRFALVLLGVLADVVLSISPFFCSAGHQQEPMPRLDSKGSADVGAVSRHI